MEPMRFRRQFIIGLAILVAPCAGCVERPGETEARQAVVKKLAAFGDLIDFATGPGHESQKQGLPDVYWVIPFRGALKLGERIYWQSPGSMRYEIEGYQIPGKIMLTSEVPKAQQDQSKGKSRDYGGNGYSLLPAGSIYVVDGKVLFKPNGDSFDVEEIIEKHRGTCPSGKPPECYLEHGVKVPEEHAK